MTEVVIQFSLCLTPSSRTFCYIPPTNPLCAPQLSVLLPPNDIDPSPSVKTLHCRSSVVSSVDKNDRVATLSSGSALCRTSSAPTLANYRASTASKLFFFFHRSHETTAEAGTISSWLATSNPLVWVEVWPRVFPTVTNGERGQQSPHRPARHAVQESRSVTSSVQSAGYVSASTSNASTGSLSPPSKYGFLAILSKNGWSWSR